MTRAASIVERESRPRIHGSGREGRDAPLGEDESPQAERDPPRRKNDAQSERKEALAGETAQFTERKESLESQKGAF